MSGTVKMRLRDLDKVESKIITLEGVDGCGKSTLASTIQSLYPEGDVAIHKLDFNGKKSDDISLTEITLEYARVNSNILKSKAKLHILDRGILSTVTHARATMPIEDWVDLLNFPKSLVIFINTDYKRVINNLNSRKNNSAEDMLLYEYNNYLETLQCYFTNIKMMVSSDYKVIIKDSPEDVLKMFIC